MASFTFAASSFARSSCLLTTVQKLTAHLKDVVDRDPQASFQQVRFIVQTVLELDQQALFEGENEMCGKVVIAFQESYHGLLL